MLHWVTQPISINCSIPNGILYWLVGRADFALNYAQLHNCDITFITTQKHGEDKTSLLYIYLSIRKEQQFCCGVCNIQKVQGYPFLLSAISSEQVAIILHVDVLILAPPKNVRIVSTIIIIHLTWEAPFTLNITDVEPDIVSYYYGAYH